MKAVPLTANKPQPTLKTWPLNMRIISYQPWNFAVHSLFVLFLFGMQIVPGLIVKRVFDVLSGATPLPDDASMSYLWWLIGLYILVEPTRLLLAYGVEWYGNTFRLAISALLERNLFASILRRPGDKPLPVSSGEAINRFDEDVGEVSDFPTWLPDQAGKWIAALIAVAIMAKINLTITLVIFLPLIGVSLITRWAWARIIYYRKASGRANDIVNGFLVEIFGAVQALKIAAAEEHVAAHLQNLNQERAQVDIRHWTYRGLLQSLNSSIVTFGIGVMLLIAGQEISTGSFTVGDFALFISYLWFTTQVPSELGTFYGDYKTQEVSIERMLALIRPEPPEALVEHHPVYEKGPIPDVPFIAKTDEHRLESLEVCGLTYHHAANGNGLPSSEAESTTTEQGNQLTLRGIENVSFSLRRGDFVVITGRVGSGKSTLARLLLGLLPRDEGEIRWNGELISEPASFFRPPRCAYTSQVPRLFSTSLRENILMGLPEECVDLPDAIHLAVLEEDIAVLDKGLDTLVGPRGIRLSGGQVQRTAAARMFVRDPELLVFDDLSSALDVETEQALWERIDERRRMEDGGNALTCLVVSHRRAALTRADRIILLKNGKVEAEGKLDDLLQSSPEMQYLWKGEINE